MTELSHGALVFVIVDDYLNPLSDFDAIVYESRSVCVFWKFCMQAFYFLNHSTLIFERFKRIYVNKWKLLLWEISRLTEEQQCPRKYDGALS